MLNSLHSFIKGFAAKIMLVLLVASFALWGIGDMVRGPGQNKELAVVGDSIVTIGEFARFYEREKQRIMNAMGGNYSPELLKGMQIPQSTLKNLINRSLLLQEAHARKLIPSDMDIARAIHNDATFHDEKGHFSKSLYLTTLKRSGIQEKDYVEQLRQRMSLELLVNTIRDQELVNDTAVETLYKSRNQQRNVTLYVMNESIFSNIAAPSKEETKAFYDKYPALFSAPEYRTLSYVKFTADDVKKDAIVSDDELEALYDERIDEFRFGELRGVEQLLYGSEDEAKKAYSMAKEGKNFDAIAKATTAMNKNAISLGQIGPDGLFEDASKIVFALENRAVSEPVQSPFGWHIFKVTSVKASGVKKFNDVKESLKKELLHIKQDELAKRLANNLDDLIAGGSTLAEAAKELGLALHTLPPVDANGISPHNVKVQMPDLSGFIETGFSLDEQSESPMRFSDNGAYFMVRADKITAAQVKPFNEVKSEVVKAWKKDKRAEKLRALATRMGKELREEKGRRNIARKNRIKMIGATGIKRSADKVAGYALPPSLMADIFVRDAGHITLPYQINENTHIIAAVSGIKQASLPKDKQKREAALTNIRKELANNSRKELVDQYILYLEQKYPVTINRSVLTAYLQEE